LMTDLRGGKLDAVTTVGDILITEIQGDQTLGTVNCLASTVFPFGDN